MTGKFIKDNRKFGGVICQSDFDTRRPAGNIAQRIESDFYFDRRLKINTELRDKAGKESKK